MYSRFVYDLLCYATSGVYSDLIEFLKARGWQRPQIDAMVKSVRELRSAGR